MSEWRVGSLPAVGRFFGIHPDVIRRDWRSRGMPAKGPDGYDVAAIARWRIQYERDRAELPADEEGQLEAARELKRRELEATARIREADAEKRERINEEAAGNILPRDEYLLAVVEAITITRDRFLSLPQQLARVVPRSQRKRVQKESERVVRKALDEFAALVDQEPET